MVTKGSEKSMLEDDGGLLYKQRCQSVNWVKKKVANFAELVVSSQTLLLQRVDIVRQKTFKAKDLSFFSRKTSTLIVTYGQKGPSASSIRKN